MPRSPQTSSSSWFAGAHSQEKPLLAGTLAEPTPTVSVSPVSDWYPHRQIFFYIMTTFHLTRSQLFLARLSYFFFLCIHFQLSETERLTGQKSVRPLQRSKIIVFHHFRSHVSKNIIHHNSSQRVPCIPEYQPHYDQYTSFFLFIPSTENPDFFSKQLTIFPVHANNSPRNNTVSPARGSTKTHSNSSDRHS